MKLLNKIEHFIFTTHPLKLVSVIYLITLFRTVIADNVGGQHWAAENPFTNPYTVQAPHDQYIFWSWLGPFVAWGLGIKSEAALVLFHFAFSLAFSFVFITFIFAKLPDGLARISLILFSILPVSATAFFWVGTDSITLFLMVLTLTYFWNKPIVFFIGIALGMQHFEHAFFAVCGLLFAFLLKHHDTKSEHETLKYCGLLLTGVLVGKFILIGVFNYYGIDARADRLHWLGINLILCFKTFLTHFHYIIWSVLGVGWLVACKYFDSDVKTTPFFLSLFGLCLLLPLCLDPSRVLAVITFPLITCFWLFNEDFLNQISKKEIALVFLTWVLIPWGSVIGGIPRNSVFPYDVEQIVNLFHYLKLN